MIDPTSRYAAIETAVMEIATGEGIVYQRRRFLPQGDELPPLIETKVAQGERLDLLAARTLGDPLQFWRICDANNAMDPLELTAEPGRVLRVPIPQP